MGIRNGRDFPENKGCKHYVSNFGADFSRVDCTYWLDTVGKHGSELALMCSTCLNRREHDRRDYHIRIDSHGAESLRQSCWKSPSQRHLCRTISLTQFPVSEDFFVNPAATLHHRITIKSPPTEPTMQELMTQMRFSGRALPCQVEYAMVERSVQGKDGEAVSVEDMDDIHSQLIQRAVQRLSVSRRYEDFDFADAYCKYLQGLAFGTFLPLTVLAMPFGVADAKGVPAVCANVLINVALDAIPRCTFPADPAEVSNILCCGLADSPMEPLA